MRRISKGIALETFVNSFRDNAGLTAQDDLKKLVSLVLC
jgi:hypothetical protein